MARPVWSGTISFGLVNVPVKAYTAVRDHTIRFHQLEKDTGERIHNQKVAGDSDEPVDASDIELGYEISSGRHVTFERDELDQLKPESTKAIEVSDFVALEEVDPIYYDRTYWLGPGEEAGSKAYHLLLAAMEDRGRVGVGTVVMRNKQYLAAIRPLDGLLAMSTMRFADEVVDKAAVDELPTRRSKPDAKALKLAVQIVDSLASDWDPEQYHDTYTEQLKDVIRRKDKGEDVVVEEAPAQSAKVLDLMAALEASVGAAKKARSSRAAAKELAKAADKLVAEQDDEDDSKPSAKKPAATKRAAAKSTAKKAAPRKKAATKKATKKKPAKARSTRKSA